MINKDLTVIIVSALHLIVFMSLFIFTDIEHLDSIAGLTVIVWGSLLVMSKKINRLNEWYEKPVKQDKQ